jgi:hypothetical protein
MLPPVAPPPLPPPPSMTKDVMNATNASGTQAFLRTPVVEGAIVHSCLTLVVKVSSSIFFLALSVCPSLFSCRFDFLSLRYDARNGTTFVFFSSPGAMNFSLCLSQRTKSIPL